MEITLSKGIFKKSLSVFMALLIAMSTMWMGLSTVEFSVGAVDNVTSGNIQPSGSVVKSGRCGRSVTYTLYENGVLVISGSGAMYNEYDYDFEFGVVEYDSPFFACYLIKNVIIEDGVTSIGSHAFYICSNLESVTIGDSVTSIGSYAFYDCDSLKSVTIPDSVTTIGSYAFRDCDNLTEVAIGDSVTTIGSYAFRDCDNLTEVAIGDGVTTIGDSAFEYCYRLESVYASDIESWLKIDFNGYLANPLYYGENLYFDGELVTDLVIPEGVTEIKKYAFYDCDSLKSVTIPYSVTKIGSNAFSYLTVYCNKNSVAEAYAKNENYPYVLLDGGDEINIVSGNIGKNFTWTLDKRTGLLEVAGSGKLPDFTDVSPAPWEEYHDYITQVSLPEGLLIISSKAFENLNRIRNITIPDSVTTIGDSAFRDCGSLTEVTIGDSVTTIGDYAFEYCDNLTEVTIGDSVTTIGNYAFRDCYSLTEVTIGYSVTTIGNFAFRDCDSLTEVTIPDSVTTIGNYAFVECDSLTEVTIGGSVATIDYFAFEDCYSLESVYASDIESWLKIGFYNAYSNPLCYGADLYFDGELVTDLVIPEGITKINSYAFYNSDSLETVKFNVNENYESKITYIPSGTFTGCSNLKEIVLPASVKNIQSNSFPSTLEKITIYNPECDIELDCGITYNSEIIGFKGSKAESFADEKAAYFTDIETIHSHSYKVITDTQPTCTEDGLFLERCSCGKENKEVRAKTGHEFKDFEVTLEPTCTSYGEKKAFCKNCDHSEKQRIEPTYHPNRESRAQQNPTCTSYGYTSGVYCPDCKTWLSGHVRIDTAGHSFTEKIIDEAHFVSLATATSPALYRYDCANCDTIGSETFTHGSALGLGKTSEITATQTTSSITLTWQPVEEAKGYIIFTWVNGAWEACAVANGTSYTFTNLPAGTKYKLAVLAYGTGNGFISMAKEYTEIETATKAALPKITVKNDASSIKLTWNKVAGATGYRVYYKSGSSWKALKTSTATSYTLKNCKAGAKYTFAVKPYIDTESGRIWSSYKTVIAATTPANPTVKVTAPSKGKLTVSWKAVNGAETYQVYYKTGNGSYKLYKTYSGAKTLNFSNLKSGTKYTFAVRAVISTTAGNVRSGYKAVSATVK